MKKVLLFTAHPDDHLCAAGLVMFLVDHGFLVTEVVFTSGEKSIHLGKAGQKITACELKKDRKAELSASSKILGISKTIFLSEQDSEITRSMTLLNKLIRVIRQEKPQIVITMHPRDLHFDHQMVGKLVPEAVDRAAWSNSKELGTSHRVLMTLFIEGLAFGRADIVVDISKFLDRKNQAVDTFKSQITPEESELLRSMNNFRGFQKGGVKAAEAFEIAGNLPIHLNELLEVFKS